MNNYKLKLKMTKLIALAVIVCSLAFATQASAISLTIGDSRYMGSIVPATPSGDAFQLSYLNHMIDMAAPSADVFMTNAFTRTNVSCGACPDAVDAGSIKNDTNVPTGIPAGYTYLYAKYGNDAHVWYVLGAAGPIDIPGTLGQGGGLSHISLYNPGTTQVPEPSSLLLIGAGLVAIGAARRRWQG